MAFPFLFLIKASDSCPEGKSPPAGTAALLAGGELRPAGGAARF